MLAQELQRAHNVAAPALHIPIQFRAQRFGLLDRRGRLATGEVRGKRHKPHLCEPVAGLLKRLRQPPPLVQHQDPWPFATLGCKSQS